MSTKEFICFGRALWAFWLAAAGCLCAGASADLVPGPLGQSREADLGGPENGVRVLGAGGCFFGRENRGRDKKIVRSLCP